MTENLKKIIVVGSPFDVDELRAELDETGFEVVHLEGGVAAREYTDEQGLPHLLIVALELPDMDGLELCELLYDIAGLPIIAIDNNPDSPRAVEALQYADDFLRGQIDVEEVAMRIRRILSRINNFSYASGPKLHIYDWLVIDPVQREIAVQGKRHKLTPIENALLHVLIKHKGDVVDADTLIERVWRSDPTVNDRNVLRVHIHRLRQKLEDDPTVPRVILTERGIGYSFADLEIG
ncbi:MAG: response regulator transcription factor [Chloroflexi bacterium]|nr:response regulator transcription factor [Chloroflexota bacterium]